MERNIDKIKRLEYELERYRQKVDRQEAELAQLRHNAKTALDGLAAAHATMNANMAVLAMWYGQKEGDVWTLKMPLFDPARILERYKVSARKVEEEDGYLIRVSQVTPE